jgi:hypothetical protein
MTREELLALRNKLIVGDPPFTRDPTGRMARSDGIAGLEERRALGDYDANAAGIRLALEACLKLAQHLLDRMKKP